jgi:hypothetical protein
MSFASRILGDVGTVQTDSRVLEDDVKARVVDPFDLEAASCILPLRKSSMNVLRLEFLREASEREDAGHSRGHICDGSHCVRWYTNSDFISY